MISLKEQVNSLELQDLYRAVRILKRSKNKYYVIIVESRKQIRIVGEIFRNDLSQMEYKSIRHNDNELIIQF